MAASVASSTQAGGQVALLLLHEFCSPPGRRDCRMAASSTSSWMAGTQTVVKRFASAGLSSFLPKSPPAKEGAALLEWLG